MPNNNFLIKSVFLLFFTELSCLVLERGLVSIRQINDNRIAGLDEILRRDHDLLAPLTRTCAEDGFVEQTRLEERSEV